MTIVMIIVWIGLFIVAGVPLSLLIGYFVAFVVVKEFHLAETGIEKLKGWNDCRNGRHGIGASLYYPNRPYKGGGTIMGGVREWGCERCGHHWPVGGNYP